MNNENSIFPNTTKYSYRQDFFSNNLNNSNNINILDNQKITDLTNTNNKMINSTNQNSIINNYNNLSKKLSSKANIQKNPSFNHLSGNLSIGNNNYQKYQLSFPL